MQEISRLTRQELYDLVWSEPVARIAERYGITGRGFAKVCERKQVPVPPRGYWMRPEDDRRRIRTALPEFVAPKAEPAPRARTKAGKPPASDRIAAMLAELREDDLQPSEEPAPPTRDYRFRVIRWGWAYSLGMQGPKLPHDAPTEELFPEFESMRVDGTLLEPTDVVGRPICLDITPVFGRVPTVFRDTSRAHVGAIETDTDPLAARAVMLDGAASRLLQLLIAGRPVSVTVTSEPDGQAEEIVVEIAFEAVQGDA